MKIKAWDMISNSDITLTASLTTDHPCSSYGQPVMVIKEWGNNDVMSHQNWVLAGCEAIELPEEETAMFEK